MDFEALKTLFNTNGDSQELTITSVSVQDGLFVLEIENFGRPETKHSIKFESIWYWKDEYESYKMKAVSCTDLKFEYEIE